MAHSSGISVGEPLLQFFGRAKASENSLRSFVVKIDTETESLELDHENLVKNSIWEQDFVEFVEKLPKNSAPCYVFFGLDHKDWILICWIPDDAPVLEKMLYSSTKAELIKEFGLDVIKDRVSWSYNEYKLHAAAEGTEAALTMEERERKEAEKNEIAHTGLRMQNKNFQGIDFKISASAEQSLSKFSSDQINLSCLTIDLDNEQIELKKEESQADPDTLLKLCSGQSCYLLYRFSALSPAGERVPFVYFCHFNSGYSSSIKSRMLYSSCKSALLDRIKHQFGVNIDFKLESEDPQDFNAQSLTMTAFPRKEEKKQAITKPQPAGRGPRRLIQ